MAEVLKHHKARKRFGQNFLNDDFWINKIAEAVDPKEGQKIIEIGPGQAALTKELIAGAKHIYCVEIDRGETSPRKKRSAWSAICPTTFLLRSSLSSPKSATAS